MVKYYIYLLKCKNENIKDCYIGSTKDIIKRKYQHQYLSTFKDNKLYNFIRNNNNIENFDFIILEEFETDIVKERYEKERFFIELYKTTLNINVPNRPSSEWKIIIKGCPYCGKGYRQDNFTHHQKTKFHINNKIIKTI
jgi:hypothetical protein